MTKQTDSDALKFRKKKISLDWGKSHVETELSPDHVAGANVLVLHPHLKTRASSKFMATSSLRSPEARLEE
ncbi:hypothetical protein MNBD_ALPHA01-1854, partial [hydrothermal vent metagenome]